MPIYLNLSTVTGESKANKHVGWIELTSLSRLENLSGISCTKNVDSTSASLVRLSISGEPQPAITIVDFVDAAGRINLQFLLENVVIGSYGLSSGGGGQPTESISLNFTKIIITRFSADAPDDAGTPLQDLLSVPTQ